MPALIRIHAVVLFFVAWQTFAPALLATTRVELVIDEPRAARNVPWPITTGVPFPRGQLARSEQCRLVDDRGIEQPLQVKVAAHWEVARDSIRWLTIDFIAQPGRKYALEFGSNVARRDAASSLKIADGERLFVETGTLQAEFSRHGASSLQAVRIDLNRDGRIAEDEVIAAGPTDGDHVYVDQHGNRFTSQRDQETREIVVESSGPVRACVRVDGWYTGPDGQRIIKYRTRYHLFAGLPLMRLVDEFRVVGSTRATQFCDIAIPLEIKLATNERQVAVDSSGESGNQIVSREWTKETESISSVQETYRHFGNLECRSQIVEKTAEGDQVRHSGERAGEWLQVADGKGVVTGSLRWFWQQFPKQWEVTANRLVLYLWSPRVDPLDFGESGVRAFLGPAGLKYLLDWKGVKAPKTPIENFFYFAGRHALARDGADGLGMNKHHELWWHFGLAGQAATGAEYGNLAAQPPLCLATGEWNCSTDVFGPLAARPNPSKYEAVVDRLFKLERYAQDTFGDYGWWLFGAGPHYSYQWDAEEKRHYADPRRFEYHTYQRETQLWWNYLRSGERKFYDWAIPSENHWVDVAVAHTPTKFSTEWRGGTAKEASLVFPVGDWSIDSPLHYVRHHDTGEAWLRSASQFWATYHRTLETTTLAYFITGDERYNDVVEFWRQFWSPLAGVRSDSTDVKPWHREQLWFEPTGPGQPSKSWAEMLRDYAPFQSGSRHQMTLFFNLSTLYEHTWDPAIGKVLEEYASAFLDPSRPNGVWQCQDHRLPSNAESPMLSHFWSSALWKYARATNDPRMPDILRRYFTAAYNADPYGEDVGIYSNVQIGYAWYFTRDPRHLAPAVHELESLLPAAEPLARPEDLGERIYNPSMPIKALTATPRLIAALADAERQGIRPSHPPLTPQRTLIALRKQKDQPLTITLWGWDRAVPLIDMAGEKVVATTSVKTFRSHRQPFDRTLPGYEVYETTLAVPAASSESLCFLNPVLETGILSVTGGEVAACWAAEPMSVEPRQRWWWQVPESQKELILETALPAQLRIVHDDKEMARSVVKNTIVIPLANVGKGEWLAIESRSPQLVWFRLANLPAELSWVAPRLDKTEVLTQWPSLPKSTTLPPSTTHPSPLTLTEPPPEFVPGKFGQALFMVPGRELHFPDEVVDATGQSRRLSDQRQGTIEFWVQRWWDERLAAVQPFHVMTNGPLQIDCLWKLPLGEWAHVAVVWRPSKVDPQETWTHIYVNGVDYATYRNLHWAGYGAPRNVSVAREWLKKFVLRLSPGLRYAIDDIRISSKPRYFDPSVIFSHRQTFNPYTFAVPTDPVGNDSDTILKLSLDGDLVAESVGGQKLEAKLVRENK